MTHFENRIATKEEIQLFIDAHPGWKVGEAHLAVDYKFVDFKAAFAFMTEAAKLAEVMGHHPTWTNTYNQLSIKLSTHDLDDQVSLLDIELATSLDKLYQEQAGQA